MRRYGYNIMVMPEGEPDRPIRSYRLPWYTPRLAIGLGIAISVLIVAALVFFILHWRLAGRIDVLSSDNESLRQTVQKMTRLDAELFWHRDFTKRVAGLIGVSVPDFADSVDRSFALAEIIRAKEKPDGQDSEPSATLREGHPGSDLGVLVSECAADPNNRPRGKPITGRISRGFAPYSDNPALRHEGIDFAVREGTPVIATASGTVIFAGQDETFGFLIRIDHGNGFETTYGHNSVLLFTTGDKSQRGDQNN